MVPPPSVLTVPQGLPGLPKLKFPTEAGASKGKGKGKTKKGSIDAADTASTLIAITAVVGAFDAKWVMQSPEADAIAQPLTRIINRVLPRISPKVMENAEGVIDAAALVMAAAAYALPRLREGGEKGDGSAGKLLRFPRRDPSPAPGAGANVRAEMAPARRAPAPVSGAPGDGGAYDGATPRGEVTATGLATPTVVPDSLARLMGE